MVLYFNFSIFLNNLIKYICTYVYIGNFIYFFQIFNLYVHIHVHICKLIFFISFFSWIFFFNYLSFNIFLFILKFFIFIFNYGIFYIFHYACIIFLLLTQTKIPTKYLNAFNFNIIFRQLNYSTLTWRVFEIIQSAECL